MKNRTLLLILIVVVAILLRFWQLGLNPPSLTWDEIAWGYNAYSLGIDGKDEFGRFLPLDYLESFGDFKPPVYAYLDVLPIKFFGLTEFAVRFPSAFFGVLTVLVTYFLSKRIFPNAKQFSIFNFQFSIAEIAAAILALSPWHINLSRAAFEANVATFFIVAGVWAFLAGIQNKKWYLIISVMSFALSIYTFNTARIVSPLLILILSIGFRKELFERRRETLIAMLIGVFVLLPTIGFLMTPQASLRFKEVNIFSDIGVIYRTNQEMQNDGNDLLTRIIHNRRFTYGVEFLRHYFDNFNPNFLFIRGDGNPKFSTQDVGQLYILELPFFIAGFFLLFKKREQNWWVVPLWLIIGIIPAATARETPHALRIETTLPTFQIIIAYGIIYFFNRISKIKYQISKIEIQYLVFILCFLFLIFNFLYYLHGYYTHYAREYSGQWQYGYKEALSYTESVEDKFDKIYFTNELGRPYIYYLFYHKLDPQILRKDSKIKREVFGFVNVERVGKYYFAKDLKVDRDTNERILYIDIESKVPLNVKKERTFYLLNGQPVLVAYTKN